MLKDKIIELYKSGIKANEISAQLNIKRPYINKVLTKCGLFKFPICKICKKSIMSLNQAHLKLHNINMKDYISQYPDERNSIGDPAWNRGLTKEISESVKKNAKALSKFLSTIKQKKKRAKQNKQMWRDGIFKPNVELCKINSNKWVEKVKLASLDERKNLLANFTKAGNDKQIEIHKNNKLNLKFHQKKYTWAQNVELRSCIQCDSEFITTKNKPKHFCSSKCYFEYILTHEYDEFILHWINKHPFWTLKKKYFSNKFNTTYIVDSSYELDFILWCEKVPKIINLIKNRPIINYEDHKYYPDFLINNKIIIELKANSLKPYKINKEILRIIVGLKQELTYMLITNQELYSKGVIIDDTKLSDIIFSQRDFVGGVWEKQIGFNNEY